MITAILIITTITISMGICTITIIVTTNIIKNYYHRYRYCYYCYYSFYSSTFATNYYYYGMRRTWLFKLLLLIDINIDNDNGAIILIRINII